MCLRHWHHRPGPDLQGKESMGTELCQEAMTVAWADTHSNELNNAEFHHWRVEGLVPALVTTLAFQQLIAILYPPGTHLYPKVILAAHRA